MEIQLGRIEHEVEKHKKEMADREEQERREQERRQQYIIEKKYKENERIEQEKEKRNKIQKKKLLEKHWEMLRWLSAFIEENKETWEEIEIAKIMEKEEIEKREKWTNLTTSEKKEEICKEVKREKFKKVAELKRASWRAWREPEKQIPPSPSKRKKDQSDGILPAKPSKKLRESTDRGPSKNNTHMEGPNPTVDQKLDNDPPNWGTCEPKDDFKIKMDLCS